MDLCKVSIKTLILNIIYECSCILVFSGHACIPHVPISQLFENSPIGCNICYIKELDFTDVVTF